MSTFYTIVAVLVVLSSAYDTFNHVKALLFNIVVLQAVEMIDSVAHRILVDMLRNVSLVWHGEGYVNAKSELPYCYALLFSAIRFYLQVYNG